MPHNNKIVGLILAAGESKRMGTDKALLKLGSGRTLLEDQVSRIRTAGVDDVYVVVGCNAEKIILAHSDLNALWVENKNWKMGNFSSVVAGLFPPLCKGRLGGVERSTSPCPSLQRRGAILLPIDCVNVTIATIKDVANEGIRTNCNIIPTFKGVGGHPVFLASNFIETLKHAPVATSRLDELLEKDDKTQHIGVTDKNILNNINTIETWLEYISMSS